MSPSLLTFPNSFANFSAGDDPWNFQDYLYVIDTQLGYVFFGSSGQTSDVDYWFNFQPTPSSNIPADKIITGYIVWLFDAEAELQSQLDFTFFAKLGFAGDSPISDTKQVSASLFAGTPQDLSMGASDDTWTTNLIPAQLTNQLSVFLSVRIDSPSNGQVALDALGLEIFYQTPSGGSGGKNLLLLGVG